MRETWRKLRNKVCPKRLYPLGTVGLWVRDDRTPIEKACDRIDEWFFQREQRKRYEKAHGSRYFKPIFDWSMGVWLRSTADIKRIEKERGMTYGSVQEWEKERKRVKDVQEREHEAKIAKQIEGVIRDVKQGRSFIREAAEQRKQIYQKYGMR